MLLKSKKKSKKNLNFLEKSDAAKDSKKIKQGSFNKKKVIFSELRVEELEKLKVDIKKELQELRFQLVTSTVPNIRKIRNLKKNYARILTVINKKQEVKNG